MYKKRKVLEIRVASAGKIGRKRLVILFLASSILCSFVPATSANDRVVKELRKEIGYVWRYIASRNQVLIRINAKDSSNLGTEVYVENLSGIIIAKVNLGLQEGDFSEDHLFHLGEVNFLSSYSSASVDGPSKDFIKTGYPVVMKGTKISYYAQPQRRKEPFIKKSLIQEYSSQLKLSKDKRIMVLIPRGKFVMGANRRYANEFPQRIENLDDFYIDKYEVSNEDMLRFAEEVKHPMRKKIRSWIENESSDQAFSRASYSLAEEYCKWADKELPTERQWEKAARGSGLKKEKSSTGRIYYYRVPRLYPWGDLFEENKVNGNNRLGKKSSVYANEIGESPYGVRNISGNVMEWTKSWYLPYENSYAQDRNFGKVFKVLRGGDFHSTPVDLTVSRRTPGGFPSLSQDFGAGIRCVYNIQRGMAEGP